MPADTSHNTTIDTQFLGRNVEDATVGDVLTFAGSSYAEWQTPTGGNGGSSFSIRIVKAVSFAFDTPGLADGIDIYTPAVGEFLVGAGFVITEQWLPDDFTTHADIGQFVDVTTGLFNETGSANSGYQLRHDNLFGTAQIAGNGLIEANEIVKFLTTDPLKLVVSQEGTIGGTPITSTSGAADLYLYLCTPGS